MKIKKAPHPSSYDYWVRVCYAVARWFGGLLTHAPLLYAMQPC